MLRASILKLFFSLILFCCCRISSAQPWEHTFGGTRGFKMMETYDNGFAILGTTGPLSNERIFLIKADVDGNVLWNKTIGTYQSNATAMDNTIDGGLILCGVTFQYDNMGAAFVLKLDACGEKQWCKIFGLPNDYDWARGVYQLTDGNYIVLAFGLGPSSPDTGRVGLIKLDTSGNIIWQNDYSHYKNSDGYSLLLTNDNGFLLSGGCYVQNPSGDTNFYWTRTMIIKVDSIGNEQWNIPYGIANYFYSRGGGARQYLDGNYLEVCTHRDSVNPSYIAWTYLIKADASGNVQWGRQIGDSAKGEWDLDILALNDSESVILSAITDTFPSNIYNLKLLKIDTAGNILDSITYDYSNQSPAGALQKTRDGKILVCSTKNMGGNNYDIYALKLNEHLQLDSLYTITLNYDSLCSTGITTGTITLDTMSYLEVEEIKVEGEFLLYPNPVANQLSVISNQLSGKSLVTIYNLLGEKIFEQETSSPKTEINLATQPNGIYFLRLRSNEKIFSEKFIISR